ncbi:ATPase, P-type (transporting), HAD superfamily, subfamily IC [Humidesulfovibrio mexicanus]|uniref:ATPase, P-type (Transporting), HAD superfamily, subfamily IC n=1 Tax=Humidesulfovibrio mexicanus TaxID=147047 RepID=A0A238YV12_9BACT|nr:cation-transporting P-type ATPase [Humidesulfovibrio mexicanus]SNR74289.1 ATPase, P-type (transporting), HAD superfamily, subfamily IC [Humidesulfovibrio mexicanus]
MNETAPLWHAMSAQDAAKRLDTDPERGLSSGEAAERLRQHGPNALPVRKGKSALTRFLLQFHQPLVYILLAAGVITALLGEVVDSSVILGVVLVNAVIGYLQESKAVRALSALSATMTTEATVLRDGAPVRLDAAALVPGDVVILRSGDKTPADVRILSSRELRSDESMLTGESLPVEKSADPVSPDAVLAERRSMAFAGALVTYGQGRAVVAATGAGTELGRISSLMESADELETPLTRKISRFSHLLLVAILVLAGLNFALGLWRGETAVDMFMASVALAVGAIPEGLPAAVTIILAIGVSRMAARRAVIRRLPAVETLGSVTVICTDKTGTLTENQMTVHSLWAAGVEALVGGTGYAPEGEITAPGGLSAAHRECLLAGLLCNDAVLRAPGEPGGNGAPSATWRVEGDPSEAALLVSAAKAGLSRAEEQAAWPRVDELAFESERQYMATLHKNADEAVIWLKGSVERVLERCGQALAADGTLEPLDAAAVTRKTEELAARGLRVLAFAKGTPAPDAAALEHEDVALGLVFLGLQGMIDPPRAEAVDAVAACRRAGVLVKMITGDHAGTAVAIGRMLGLSGPSCEADGHCRALTGAELARLSDAQFAAEARAVSVFARVSPEQKLRLVRALQAQGEVVAMTGDGVNDAPALKQADIGVAMGQAGTDAAKEAADMVLTDDNFASIAAAVEEGRGVFDNLVKFIAWTLPTNLGEGMVILTAFLFGVALPILPVQILWINMTTAAALGLMLSFEPKEPGIMDRAPRAPGKPILDRLLAGRIALVGALLLVTAFGLFEYELSRGASLEQARTVAVNVFVLVETAYLFNARSFRRSPFALGFFSNPWASWGAGLMLALQGAYTYVPAMNALFQSAPLAPRQWPLVLGSAVAVFLLVEIEKKLRNGLRRTASASHST